MIQRRLLLRDFDQCTLGVLSFEIISGLSRQQIHESQFTLTRPVRLLVMNRKDSDQVAGGACQRN